MVAPLLKTCGHGKRVEPSLELVAGGWVGLGHGVVDLYVSICRVTLSTWLRSVYSSWEGTTKIHLHGTNTHDRGTELVHAFDKVTQLGQRLQIPTMLLLWL